MNTYVDYRFYVDEYGGKGINEDDFPAAALRASQYVRTITLNRADNHQGEEVKYAVCAVADIYHEIFEKEQENVPEKRSETTDGYSVSYVVQQKDGESKETLFRRRAYERASYWLTGTGLLQRGVKRC